MPAKDDDPKTSDPKTPDPKTKTSEVDEKQYGVFASMMNRFLSEKEEADKNKPHRTPASEPDESPSVLQRLFGG